MLRLRDFLHLPQLDSLIKEIVSGKSGMIVVAGLDPRAITATATDNVLLPSGRVAIFDILFQEFLDSRPKAKAVVIARDRATARVPRHLKHRISFSKVEQDNEYETYITSAVKEKPELLVIDRLTPTNAPTALDAAAKGIQILVQLDTVMRGAKVARQIYDMGIHKERLAGLSWIVAVQRLGTLCPDCKEAVDIQPERLERIAGIYPHLSVLLQELFPNASEGKYYREKGCARCHGTGRSGDIAAFDVFQASTDTPELFEQSSRLSIEEYLLHLISLGRLPLDDLLTLETDQLRRAYHLLTASEHNLTEANIRLNSKLVELESANRVLLQRTEVLVALQDMGHALITSEDLMSMADQVCQRAAELCGAERAILYHLPTLPDGSRQAQILAVHGWPHHLINRQLDDALVVGEEDYTKVISFPHWPPGVPRPSTFEDRQQRLRAGLRVPLIAQNTLVGLMLVHALQKSRFKPGEVALLQTFANQAALAMQRARLVDELRAKIDQLEAAQAELVKKERLEHELKLARQVQQSVLPRTFPKAARFAFAAQNEPARQVGGDFYDIFEPDDRHFGVVIGDVSDKGMPAALFMALTRSLLLAEARREQSPGAVLANVNRLLMELGEPNQFVSVFYGIIDKASGRMVYARAGHDRPLLLRGSAVLTLGGDGAVLGVLEDDELSLTDERIDLAHGDRLVLYTDGLTDVVNPQNQFYGLDNLRDFLLSKAHLPAAGLCEAAFVSLKQYQGTAEQFDDMTLVVVEVK